MSPLIGFLHAVLVVLAVGGGSKLVRPASTTAALITAGMIPIRRRRWATVAARVLGVVEVVVGVVALVAPGPLVLALAAGLYVGFNLFLARLARRDIEADCGCLGSASRPAGPLHRRVNLAAATVCAWSAVAAFDGWPIATPADLLGAGPAVAVPYALVVLTLAGLLALGPGLLADLRPPPRVGGPGAVGGGRAGGPTVANGGVA